MSKGEATKAAAQLAKVSSSSQGGEGASSSSPGAGLAGIAAAMARQQQVWAIEARIRESSAKKLAAVEVKKEDLDLLCGEYEGLGGVTRAALDKHLRACGGDVALALRKLVGLL